MFNQKVFLLANEPVRKEVTLTQNEDVQAKAIILYLHGGGLIFGNRDDLPNYHLQRLTDEGYVVISVDYLLAPSTRLPEIVEDLKVTISTILLERERWLGQDLPYYLWGRSAGAYLSLLLGGKGGLNPPPHGVVSFYGYAFLQGNWFESKNAYFNKTYPALDASWLDQVPDGPRVEGDLRDAMGVYIYARQKGIWKELVYGESDNNFLDNFSLKNLDHFPLPLFCAHATGDYDVPFDEFLALQEKYQPSTFTVDSKDHDFDRDSSSDLTVQVLDNMIAFLNNHIKAQS